MDESLRSIVNDLALAVAVLEQLQELPEVPAELREMTELARNRLLKASACLRDLRSATSC